MVEMTKAMNSQKSWMNKIVEAAKREKTFRTEGKRCVQLYEAATPEKTPFAILYSNTETLAPALYNARPIPIVERRFKDSDPTGKAAAEVSTRLLKYLIEVESVEYDTFDDLVQAGVLETLCVNRGVTRFKYEADTEGDTVQNECVYGEAVRWDKFSHGYARTWKKVPWICFEWDMTREELIDNFGAEIAAKVRLDGSTGFEGEESASGTGETREQMTGVKLARVYEVWDKTSRSVKFLSPSYDEGFLKELPDPLKLANFFPTPRPLNFMRKVSTLVPTPLYIQYEAQAKELNDITVRLRFLIRALKVRGMYNSTIEGIEKVLTAEDNDMVPVENMASMPDGQGIEKVLFMMPLESISTTVTNLYAQREQIKQVIYEITGISDILRGASVASETATAQNIKNQWGTLRLKKLQKEVMRYCRDSLRIMLEIAVTKFSPETVKAMTGLNFPTEQEKQQVQAALQMGQQPSPEVQQLMAMPSWQAILGLLQNDTLRNYRVDIETNSTIDVEASQDKQDISELLNAISQFLNGVGPLIEKGIMPFDVAKSMLLAVCRRYTFGPQLEDSINNMTAPQPQQEAPNPADMAKLEGIKAQSAADAQRAQMEMQLGHMEMQMKQMEFEHKMELMQQQRQLDQDKIALEQAQLQNQLISTRMKSEQMTLQHSQKMQQIATQAAADKSKPKETPNASV